MEETGEKKEERRKCASEETGGWDEATRKGLKETSGEVRTRGGEEKK